MAKCASCQHLFSVPRAPGPQGPGVVASPPAGSWKEGIFPTKPPEQAPEKKGHFFRVMATLFMVGGALTALLYGNHWREGVQSEGFVEGRARILESALNSSVLDRGGARRHSPRVVYEYQVDGEVFRADRVHVHRVTSDSNKEPILRLLRQYPPGAEVPVFYDPEDPEVAVLRTGPTKQSRKTAKTGLTVFLICAGLLAYDAYKQSQIVDLTTSSRPR